MRRAHKSVIVIWAILATTLFAIESTVEKEIVIAVKEQPSALDKTDMDSVARQLLIPSAYICFKELIYLESRGNPDAHNTSSGAKGIGQLLPQTYTILGLRHSPDEKVQMVAMLAYLARHYGGKNAACKALAFHRIHNYY